MHVRGFRTYTLSAALAAAAVSLVAAAEALVVATESTTAAGGADDDDGTAETDGCTAADDVEMADDVIGDSPAAVMAIGLEFSLLWRTAAADSLRLPAIVRPAAAAITEAGTSHELPPPVDDSDDDDGGGSGGCAFTMLAIGWMSCDECAAAVAAVAAASAADAASAAWVVAALFRDETDELSLLRRLNGYVDR